MSEACLLQFMARAFQCLDLRRPALLWLHWRGLRTSIGTHRASPPRALPDQAVRCVHHPFHGLVHRASVDRLSVSILGVLDQEDHQERDDCSGGIDDQLPGSLNRNSGPVTIHTMMRPTAIANTGGRPQKCAASFAKREYQVALRITEPPLSGHLESDRRQLKCSGFDGRFVGRASFQSQLLARRKQADRLLQPPRFRFLLLSGIDPTDVHSPV